MNSRRVQLPTIEELLSIHRLEEKDILDPLLNGKEDNWLIYLAKIWRIEEACHHLQHR